MIDSQKMFNNVNTSLDQYLMINIDEEQLGLASEDKISGHQKVRKIILHPINKIMLISVILGIVIIFMIAMSQISMIKMKKQEEDQRYRKETQQIIHKFQNELQKIEKNVDKQLPKILWIVLEKDPLSLPALEQLILNNIQFIHKKSSFQVRIVNIKKAYSFLSASIIERMSKIMQTRKVDMDVTEIVRLALLLQKGGVSIKIGSTILIQSFDWIKQIFSQFSKFQRINFRQQVCKSNNKTKVFLFKDKDKYLDFVIAATPQSQFLWSCLLEMEAILQYGRWPSSSLVIANEQLLETNVIRLNSILESIINIRVKINYLSTLLSNQNRFKIDYNQAECLNQIKTISFQSMPVLVLGLCFRKNKYFAYSSRDDLVSVCGQPKYLIYGTIQHFRDQINEIISSSNINLIHPKSILAQFLNIKNNKRIWEPLINTERWVNFCIIGPNPISSLTRDNLQNMQYLRNQSYVNWTAFYFYQQKKNSVQQGFIDIFSRFNNKSQANIQQNIIFLDSKNGKNSEQIRAKNIEEAISNSCSKHSIAIIMDLSQKMRDLEALQKIAQIMKKAAVFGIMLNIKNEQIINKAVALADRSCWNGRYNNYEQEMILNNWRVFDTDLYKIIPQQNLHNLKGQYYSFLSAQLIMLGYSCHHDYNKVTNSLTLRRFREEMALPQQLVISEIIIDSDQKFTINTQQFDNIFRFKPNALSLDYVAEDITNRQISYKKVLVFNENTKLLRNQRRNFLHIPKIIHQIWIQGEIPPIRKDLQLRNLVYHPDYEYYLWTKENITSQNFPFTYRLLKNLQQFDKKSTYSKMAMMADLMRYEVLYKYGGFYYDMNLQLFKPLFDEWRKYRFVSATQIQPRSRYTPIQSLIGAEKQYPPLFRLLQPSAINAINIFDTLTNVATGPYYYSQTVIGREELSPQVLLIPYENLFSFRDLENQNLCEIKYQHHWWESRQKMKQNLVHQIKKNCSAYYPYAIGLDHYIFGASWVHRRKKSKLVN